MQHSLTAMLFAVAMLHDCLASCLVHGQLTNDIQNGVVLSRAYDSLNRPTGYRLMQNAECRMQNDGGGNLANLVNPVEVSYSYDSLGRFSGVGFNAEAQRSRGDFEYSYLPGTDLISGYTAGGFSRSVTYESNRTLIAAITNSFSPAGETYHLPLSTYHYSNDSLGRRPAITRGGAAFGDLAGATDAYGYNLRSEVVSSTRTPADSPVRGFDYAYAYDPIGNRTSATDYDEQGNPLVSSYSANALNQYTSRTVPGYATLRGEAATNATITVNERPVWRIGQERLLPNMAAGQPPPEKSGGHTTCEYDCGSFHHSIKIYGKCPDPGWYKLKGVW